MLSHKSKDTHSIHLEHWDNYLKKMYDYPYTMGTTLITPIKGDVFSLDGIESGINKIANGKAKDIEGYQDEILKMGRSILIPYLHKLLNLALTHGFPRLLTGKIVFHLTT